MVQYSVKSMIRSILQAWKVLCGIYIGPNIAYYSNLNFSGQYAGQE